MLVALVILAVLTAAVGLNFYGPLRKQALSDDIDAVERFDGDARTEAIVHGLPVRLIINVTDHSMGRYEGDDFKNQHSQLHVSALRQARISDTGFESGPIDLDISAKGFSRSYAVMIGDRWISFAGLSGEAIVEDHAHEMRTPMSSQ